MSGPFTPVLCNDGKVISLGASQRDFLAQHGHIRYLGRAVYGGVELFGTYEAPAFSVHEVNAIVMAEPSLRDCDLCSEGGGGQWSVACRAFELREGPNRGATLGGPVRPVLICSECKPYIERGDWRRCLEYLLDAYVERAYAEGALPRAVSKRQARDAIRPMLQDVVTGVFHNMTGPPEEL